MGFTGFYWVLLGFTGFYWDLTKCYWSTIDKKDNRVGISGKETGRRVVGWDVPVRRDETSGEYLKPLVGRIKITRLKNSVKTR